MNTEVEKLLSRAGVWRGHRQGVDPDTCPAVASGYAVLDQCLAGGGWPRGALTEILSDHCGIGELALLRPALSFLSQQPGWILWVAPPFLPYPPALAAAGILVSRVLVIQPQKPADLCWAMEQGLRSGSCSAVLGWPARLDNRAIRKLQLAAESGQCPAFLFRPQTARINASPAALRLELTPLAEGLAFRILKRRGGWPVAPQVLDRASLQLPGLPPKAQPPLASTLVTGPWTG